MRHKPMLSPQGQGQVDARREFGINNRSCKCPSSVNETSDDKESSGDRTLTGAMCSSNGSSNVAASSC
ncbi:hypothetical protein CDL15_Pgr016587 [Punica granatum]|uniref:Uncharacterized protein n=1 Tax=Punica granatum TaxID=22663 RepID=A0A218XSU7_PUNGR|nr:hypothetical protein CDL15_Pgr016587 [Punica granatum]PKI62663.1 hypothetical protein CRG98_016934 [Punica granatum]